MARCCFGWGKKKDLVELQADGRKILNPLVVIMRNLCMKYALLLTFAAVVVAGLLAGCGADESTPAPTPEMTASATMTTPGVETEWDGILGTTVLRPGSQRVAFLLVGAKALVTVPEVEVATFFVGEDGSADGPHEVIKAGFNLWPYGTRGSYTTDLSFDRTGLWKLEIVGQEEGSDRLAIMEVEVTDGFEVVDVGQKAPASMNRTVGDGAPLEELSSAHEADPELYSTRIADALEQGSPTMVVFSTPSFCTSATCGPQVETVSEVRRKYEGQASFIHVEVYENPHEVQGDLTRARTSPIMGEWGLTSVPEWTNESWVFVVDESGVVTARFEAYSSADELEAALKDVLG